VLLDELDPSVFQSYMGVVDSIKEKFSDYTDQISGLEHKLMLKDVLMKEL
jgi:hypothetical protein